MEQDDMVAIYFKLPRLFKEKIQENAKEAGQDTTAYLKFLIYKDILEHEKK